MMDYLSQFIVYQIYKLYFGETGKKAMKFKQSEWFVNSWSRLEQICCQHILNETVQDGKQKQLRQ